MAKIRGHITINVDKCKGCELCTVECPQESLQMSQDLNHKGYKYAVLVEDNCTGCTNCALVCPEAVITVYRDKKKEPVATLTNVKDNISISID